MPELSTEAPVELEEIAGSAETNAMRERVVVSPCEGRFFPPPPEVFTTEGEWVQPGQVLAEVVSNGTRVPVVSRFSGWLMGMLALEGQPVHSGEALFWLWSC